MSTQVTINDVPPKTQITATAGQTVFTTNWTANAASDVVVYARTSVQEPDDLTQEVSSANYTVAFIGVSETVEVTFLVGRAAGDVVTITRDTPADRLNLYTNTNFTPSMLNQDVGILTLVDQQAQLYNTQVAPHYNVSATPDLGDPITGLGGDMYLPVLGANQFWVKNTANTEITATDLPSGGGQLPVTLPLLTYTSTPYLTNEANLGALSTGLLYQTVAGGIASFSTLGTTGTGNVVLDNGPTLTNPIINQINDANGNTNLSFSAAVNAVNYMKSVNSATGGYTGFEVAGSDTNANAFIKPKGDAGLAVITSAVTAVPFAIYSGTAQQHATTFNFSNTAATRAVTFQDADGTVAYLSDITGAAASVQVFAATGTWTKPAGIARVIVCVVGGGGGSGGTAATGVGQVAESAGGGGGGYSQKIIDVSAVATVAVTVGTGGAGAAAGNNTGSTGNTSSFGAYCSATGGVGGAGGAATSANSSSAGGAGGVGSGGDINLTGTFGGNGRCIATNAVTFNWGGSTQLSPLTNHDTSTGAAVAGTIYGGGASGANAGSGSAAKAGAAGANGVVIVYEYK